MHPYGGIPICPRCVKAVYAAEQIMGPGRMLYHRPCLACSSCNKRLDSLSLVEHDKEPYCKQCYNKNFGPRDLRQANLPHRDDAPTPLSSSPIRPAYTGLPTRSFRSTSPTQEEKNVEARFERAKREPERLGSSSPFGTNYAGHTAYNTSDCGSYGTHLWCVHSERVTHTFHGFTNKRASPDDADIADRHVRVTPKFT
ncbi:hypothetical protein EW145_g7292, partial [Phellinidium pouzarii]